MKWFKHISDSLDDPFIFDLTSKFGGDGYLVFFGVLEVYSREFKTEHDWKLTVSQRYLTRKLNKRQSTLVVKILKHIQKSGKWNVGFDGTQITIHIPKFTELIDNWSRRKLRSNSEGAPPKHQTNKDKRSKKEIKKDQYSDSFLKFWSAYPKKKSKGQAWKTWKKLGGQRPVIQTLLDAIDVLKKTDDWKKDGGQFIPHPSTWLNAFGWEDEVNDIKSEQVQPPKFVTEDFAIGNE